MTALLPRLAGGVLATGVGCLAYGVGIERRWYARHDETLPVLRRPVLRRDIRSLTGGEQEGGGGQTGRGGAQTGRGGAQTGRGDALTGRGGALTGRGGAGRLRVLLFSDLHYAPWQQHRLDYLRRVAAAAQPDLIISGGDNLEHEDAVQPVVQVHRDLLASTGAQGVAILGAHDRFAPHRTNPALYLKEPSSGPVGRLLDTDALVTGLQAGGWEVLENAGTRVATPVGSVDVVGVDDPHIQRDDVRVIRSFEPDPEAVLRLGLVHAPYRRVLRAYEEEGFDLTLAGHTHGGQLAIPGWGALVTNCDLSARDAKGTSMVGGRMPLHVSAGLGHSIYYPIRFACRPELSVLDLVPAP